MALMQSERVPDRPGMVRPVSSERMGRMRPSGSVISSSRARSKRGLIFSA